MGRIIDTENFDINDFIIDDEKSMFEEELIDCIREWLKSGKDPDDDLELLKEQAQVLTEIALRPIPCWEPQDLIPENGLFKVKNGTALTHNGYFVMLQDLIDHLPRTLNEEDAKAFYAGNK